jgi:arylsulfatase A-like enzyme
MPTVLELLGLPIPTQAQGKSLVSVIDGSDTGTDRTAVVTLTDDAVTAIVAADGWKLHMSRQTGARELYYLPADPSERNDLSRSYPAQVNALVARLDAWAQANQIRLIAGNDRDQPRGGGG